MRDAVLESVRKALRRRGDVALPEWSFPSLGEEDLVSRFVAEAVAVGCEVVESVGGRWWEALAPFVLDLDAVVVGPGVDATRLGKSAVDLPVAVAQPLHVLGLVSAQWAVAESGSVVVEDDGAQLSSLVVDTCAILVPRDALVLGLEDLPPPEDGVRCRVVVTGPSRTSDIEKRLVLGAHGPRRTILVLV